MKNKITVIVPATSANCGPGYDSLGLACNLYNDFTFEILEFSNEENLNNREKYWINFYPLKQDTKLNIPTTTTLDCQNLC